MVVQFIVKLQLYQRIFLYSVAREHFLTKKLTRDFYNTAVLTL